MELTRSEQLKIIAQFQKVIKDDTDAKQVTQRHCKNCPYCNTDHIIIHGSYKKRKRYLCKDCGKTFTDQTDTPLHNIKKQDKFLNFIILSKIKVIFCPFFKFVVPPEYFPAVILSGLLPYFRNL